MPSHFWPTLPIVIPASPGVAMWWDIVFWLFQAVIMTTLVVLLRKWALDVDRLRSDGTPTDVKIHTDGGQNIGQ